MVTRDTTRLRNTAIRDTAIRQRVTDTTNRLTLVKKDSVKPDTNFLTNVAKIDTVGKNIVNFPVLPLPDASEIKFRNRKPFPWIFPLSCVILLLIGLNRIINIRRYDKLFWGSFNGAAIKSNEALFKELSIQHLITLIITCLIIGLGIFILIKTPWDHLFINHLSRYFFIVTCLLFIYMIKAFSYFLVITILQLKETPVLVTGEILMITYALALLLFPVILTAYYAPFALSRNDFIFIVVLLGFIFLIFRGIRTLITFSRIFPYSIFYLFIYLCSLEIAPWFYIYAWAGLFR